MLCLLFCGKIFSPEEMLFISIFGAMVMICYHLKLNVDDVNAFT